MFEYADSSFIVDSFRPAYLSITAARWAELLEEGRHRLQDCRGCPRDCHVNRVEGEIGLCQTGRHARVASAGVHHGEEDCLSGSGGSGTIFFGGCSLRCAFCQNWEISQLISGSSCSADRVAAIMLQLQDCGCHNINFVTPSHLVPQIIEAIAEAVPQGLKLPIVYNTSAYDSLESLRLLDGLVDIYMPDFKFWDADTANHLANAPDYPTRARDAIREMHRQVGPLQLLQDGTACRGLLVRHLVMPGQVDQSASIFDWLAREISTDTCLNIMGQYRPEHSVGTGYQLSGEARFVEINRRPRAEEVQQARAAAESAGLWRFA